MWVIHFLSFLWSAFLDLLDPKRNSLVSKEEAEERTAVCHQCHRYVPKMDLCHVCYCKVGIKAQFRSSVCLENKWVKK